MPSAWGHTRLLETDWRLITQESHCFSCGSVNGTTDENGLLSAVLPLGTYIVTEISAPEDYIIDDTPKTVLLDEDGEVLELTVVNILEIEDVEPLPLPEEEEEEALPRTGSENVNYLYGLGLILILGGTVLLSKKKRTVK